MTRIKEKKKKVIADTARPRGLFLLPDVILFPSVVEHPHYSIHPAPTLIFKEPKFCSFTKAQSEGPSIGRRTRSKSDYFHWDPPFSTCHLTVSLPLCSPWRKPSIFVIMEPGEGCIIAFTAIYFRSKRDTTAPPSITSSPPYIYIYIFFYSFEEKKNWATRPRGTQSALIHSHLFFFLQGLSLYPQVICSGRAIKAITVASLSLLLWAQMSDNGSATSERGHSDSIYPIRKHGFNMFFFYYYYYFSITFSLACASITKHKQTGQNMFTTAFFLNENNILKSTAKDLFFFFQD